MELAFSKLKAHIKRLALRTVGDPWKAVGAILELFSKQECANFFLRNGIWRKLKRKCFSARFHYCSEGPVPARPSKQDACKRSLDFARSASMCAIEKDAKYDLGTALKAANPVFVEIRTGMNQQQQQPWTLPPGRSGLVLVRGCGWAAVSNGDGHDRYQTSNQTCTIAEAREPQVRRVNRRDTT